MELDAGFGEGFVDHEAQVAGERVAVGLGGVEPEQQAEDPCLFGEVLEAYLGRGILED